MESIDLLQWWKTKCFCAEGWMFPLTVPRDDFILHFFLREVITPGHKASHCLLSEGIRGEISYLRSRSCGFPGGPESALQCGAVRSVSGWGAKTPHASEQASLQAAAGDSRALVLRVLPPPLPLPASVCCWLSLRPVPQASVNCICLLCFLHFCDVTHPPVRCGPIPSFV